MAEIVYLTACVLALATGLSIIMLNPWRSINRAFALAITLGAFWSFCVFMAMHIGVKEPARQAGEVLFWLRMNLAVASFLPWSFLLIKVVILDEGSFGGLLARTWPYMLAACLLAMLAFSAYTIPKDSTSGAPQRGMGYYLHIGIISVLCAGILADAYRKMRSSSGVRRLEIKFFLINYCLGALVVLAANAANNLMRLPLLRYAGPFVILISTGLIIWALCHHRVFDARQIFASLGRRISTLVVLAGCTVALNSALSPTLLMPGSLVISAGIAGLLATLWDNRIHFWLGLDSARLLAKPRTRIIAWARSESDPEKLRELFEEFLRDWCQTDLAELLPARGSAYAGRRLAFSNHGFVNLCRQGWVTPEHLQRLRPEPAVEESLGLMDSQGLAAVIAVPRGSDTPSLLVALGPKHSLRPYTYPDIVLLLNLAELMDNILSHARMSAHAAKISRMESAAMMSRGLAHDLNNLTTPVSTYLLHREGQDHPGTAEAEVYHAARNSIKVMQDYIRESLFFARRLVPEFKILHTGEVMASAVRLAQERAAGRGVKLRIAPGESLEFTADYTLVQRLVLNLVNNAVDASRPGAVVEISAAGRSQDRICIAVADHGPGIPAENLKRIFDPYFTTKDTGDEIRGLGLGLAICRKIADLHGGEIEVISQAGRGTTFAAVFPKTPAQKVQEEYAPETSIARDTI